MFRREAYLAEFQKGMKADNSYLAETRILVETSTAAGNQEKGSKVEGTIASKIKV